MTYTREQEADFVYDYGDVAICGTRMVEYARESFGVRWCFHCRRRHEFTWVYSAPDGLSYYGPSACLEGVAAECTDLFPGWSRWAEDE